MKECQKSMSRRLLWTYTGAGSVIFGATLTYISAIQGSNLIGGALLALIVLVHYLALQSISAGWLIERFASGIVIVVLPHLLFWLLGWVADPTVERPTRLSFVLWYTGQLLLLAVPVMAGVTYLTRPGG